jgi:hypothetical protein
MSRIEYNSNSPYFYTPQYSWHIGNYEHRPIFPNGEDTMIVIEKKYQYRPEYLSDDLYGTPAYWWVFCIRNPFLRSDPIWNFVTGLDIMVPSAKYLNSIMGS